MPEARDAAPRPDSRRHDAAELAKQEGLPVEIVEDLYESSLADLGKEARVRDFLPVLVENRVRRELRRKKRREAAPGKEPSSAPPS